MNGCKHPWWAVSVAVAALLFSGCGGGGSGSGSPTPQRLPAGSLDPDFGSAGVVIVDNGHGDDSGNDVCVDAAGRIVVAGSSVSQNDGFDAVVWRFADDGSADPGFGTAGTVRYDHAHMNDVAAGVGLDANGRILVAGSVQRANDDQDMALWRFADDGSADTTFGQGGMAAFDFGGSLYERFFSVVPTADGTIYAAGQGGADPPDYKSIAVVARLTADGSLDAGFGNGGESHYASGVTQYAMDMATDAAGRVLAAGYTKFSLDGDWDILTLRFLADGLPDPSFASDGVFLYDSPNDNHANGDVCWAMAVDGQQRIVLAGQLFNGTDYDAALLRLTADGSLDPSFGNGGIVLLDGEQKNDGVNDLAIDAAGRLLAAGFSFNAAGDVRQLAVWRLTADGSLDAAFGTGGMVRWQHGQNSLNYANGICLDAAGRILVTGVTDNGQDRDMVLLRLMP